MKIQVENTQEEMKKEIPPSPPMEKSASPETNISPQREKPLPQNPKARADLYYREGKFLSAIEEQKKVLQSKPKDAEVHLSLGQLYMADGKYGKEALFHLQKVLEIAPNHPRRKNIELWIQSLKKETISIPPKPKEKIGELLKKRLARESDPDKRKEMEMFIQKIEKP